LAPLQTVAADDERTLGKSKRGHARSWSKEKWCEAEPHRVAGESELKSLASVPEKKAEAYFDRSLANRPSTGGQILGTPLSNEHGTALAQSS